MQPADVVQRDPQAPPPFGSARHRLPEVPMTLHSLSSVQAWQSEALTLGIAASANTVASGIAPLSVAASMPLLEPQAARAPRPAIAKTRARITFNDHTAGTL